MFEAITQIVKDVDKTAKGVWDATGVRFPKL